jgi:hypothetical protein
MKCPECDYIYYQGNSCPSCGAGQKKRYDGPENPWRKRMCECCMKNKGFQPFKGRTLCYHCFETAWGQEGQEPYNRDKFKASLIKIKDPNVQKAILKMVSNGRSNA